jgi:hypothetical protein
MTYVLVKNISPGKKIQGTYDRVDLIYTGVKTANDLVTAASDLGWEASKAYRDSAPALTSQQQMEVIKDLLTPQQLEAIKDLPTPDQQLLALKDSLSAAQKKAIKDALLQHQQSVKDALARLIVDAKAATEQISKAKEIAGAAWDLLPRDPPIDSITHTVKFVVSGGGSVTPTWSLVRFRGPAQGNPLLGASRVHTNQLDVVLGQPAMPGGKALSDEQSRQLFNLQLDSLRARLVPLQIQ